MSLSGLSLPPLFSPFVGWGTGRGGGEGSCAISALQATAGASSLSLSPSLFVRIFFSSSLFLEDEKGENFSHSSSSFLPSFPPLSAAPSLA